MARLLKQAVRSAHKSIALGLLMIVVFDARAAIQHDPMRPAAPFLPQPQQQTHAPDMENHDTLVLQSIIFSSQRKIAIINGQYLHIGESIGAYKLKGLSANQAQLQDSEGRLYLLELVPGIRNQPFKK